MTGKLPTAFFAYPSQPASIPETIRAAIEAVNASKQLHVYSWEELRIGGKFIIDEILKKIDSADIFFADLTGLNPNVLFELGYAIARGKHVWLTLETSLGGGDFTEFRTLSTVGYAGYTNSAQISQHLFRDQPHASRDKTLLDSVVTPSLLPGQATTILYLKSQVDTEASVQMTRRLESVAARRIVDDPKEIPAQTLSWYAQQIYSASAVVCHFTNPARPGSRLRNARYALVAGMAMGLEKRLLILSEGDYVVPLDYRDLLRLYTTAAAAERHLDTWLRPLEDEWSRARASQESHSARIRLATELKNLQFGDYIAENEGESLVDGYFIETAAYREARQGTHTIFVGRKGTGKSATFLQLGAQLGADPRNVLSVIKPVAYELEGILRILARYSDRDRKGYVIEALWKFLLYSDIAFALATKLRTKNSAALTRLEREFLDFFDTNDSLLTGEFSARLERCILRLEQANNEPTELAEWRRSISEILHADFLPDLRSAIARALPRGARVAVLIDNLDKSWDRQSDLHSLAEFLLGLLGAANKVGPEIKKLSHESLVVSLAVFLRADIFDRVTDVAREPDKLRYTRLNWVDPHLLIRLVEERYRSFQQDDIEGDTLWSRFFCDRVHGQPTKNYLTTIALPRPRDFIYLTRAAVSTAIDRGHATVEESDVKEARKTYSAFAFQVLTIEDNTQDGVLEKCLFEFVGLPAILEQTSVWNGLARSGVPGDRHEDIIRQLCALSFFGIEVAPNDFRFAENATELKKFSVMASRHCETHGSKPRYMIHPAFRPFLEIPDA